MAITYDPATADPGTIQKIPYDKVVIDPNIREDIRLDKGMISSVRVRGFEQYPVGYQDDTGLTHITIGQRRVSAALEIGWPVIPIVIKPKSAAEADRAEEHRILSQLAENEQRAPLNDAESAGAYKQLALLGVTEDQIARKTNSPRARITTALKVAGDDKALAAIEQHHITLDQAAVLVEFRDDEKATAELVEAAKTRPDRIEHVAQAHRNRIARQRDGQSIADKARAEGWKVQYREDQHSYGLPAGLTRIESLWREDDKKQTKLTLDDVKDHPARVVFIDTMFNGDTARVEWCIRDHKKHGFASHYDSTSSSKGPLSEEEKEARRQKRIDKSEMTDATIVRRAWITATLLPGKLDLARVSTWLVKATYQLADALRYDQARDDDALQLACELLGLELIQGKWQPDAEATIEAALKTAGVLDETRMLLALAIARVEYPAGNPKHHRYGQHEGLAPYFLQLQSWGYTLADVEQRIVDAASKKGTRK